MNHVEPYDPNCEECQAMPTKPATHTPGPWKLTILRSEESAAAKIPHLEAWGRVDTPFGRVFEAKLADARLIAAAPELLMALEALSMAVKATRDGKRDGGTFGTLSLADDVARVAIAKARG